LIWIIGGTSDVKKLANRIHGCADYIVTVISEEGKMELEGYNAIVRKMGFEDMKRFISNYKVKLIVDMSHPFAQVVSQNAREAAISSLVKYVRYLREYIHIEGCRLFDSFEDCAEYLKDKEGDVFFTIGTKNIGLFEKIKGKRRFIYRVLPTNFSIEVCKRLNIPVGDIVAMKGTFSVELNAALFKEYNVKYVVMKDSGIQGGTIEKINACKILGIEPLLIKRPKEEGVYDLEEIVLKVKELGLWKKGDRSC
jgi:precorrin-6A/cobalt-precorrin-6A reductase